MEIPNGFSIRRPDLSDAEVIAALINARSRSEIGVDLTDTDEVLRELGDPTRNRSDDNWLIIAEDGTLAAQLQLYEYPPFTTFGFDGDVHPAHTDRGLGRYLLETIEARARREAHRAPAGEQVLLQTRVSSVATSAQALLSSVGYAHTRNWRRMEIDATIAPEQTRAVDGITIRTLTRGVDERPLWETMEAAFADHWGYAPMPFEEFMYYEIDGVSDFDPALFFLAMDGDQIAGAATCHPSRGGDTTLGWIGGLGVRREWRGRGIGRQLLLTAFGEFHRRGHSRVGLHVDGSSLTGADRLYERAGMHEVRHDYIFEKVLRPAANPEREDEKSQRAESSK
ncbi:MAG: GNAT family N-acetyltransferase [Thermomicrobiales bacterium]|nr:GNAT family N-acetyltransferase [Thermomicrobiales bacterium]